MKSPRLLLPAPCSWGLAILLAASAIPAHAVTLSLPGMAGVALPPEESGNLAVDAGGAGKSGGGGTTAAAANARVSVPETPAETPASTGQAPEKKPRPQSTPRKPAAKPAKKPSGTKPRPEPEVQPEIPAEPQPETTPPPLSPVTGKELVSGKDPIPAAKPVDLRPTFYLTTGWSDKLYFRGLDLLDRVSPDDAGSGAFSARAKIVKGGWEFGAQYLQGLDRMLPDRDAAKSEPNLLDPDTGLWNPDATQHQNFNVPSKERYAEIDVWASYTHNLGNNFSGTLGVTYYRFLNKQFWGIRDAFEAQAALSYSGFKWVEPSLLYAYDFTGFKGGYAELTLNAKNIPYWSLFGQNSGMQWSAVPYMKLAYDMDYNGEGSDWNHLEAGVNVPVVLNKHFALNLNAAYIHNLSDWTDTESRPGTTLSRDRADDGWWFGLSFSTATKLGAFPSTGMPDYSGKDKVPMFTEPDNKWRLSGGFGWHSIDGNFATARQTPVSSLSLVQRRTSSDLGFATGAADKTYTYYDNNGVIRSGTVHSATGQGALDGTARYSGTVPGNATGVEVDGTRAERNQQVRFRADEYQYDNRISGEDVLRESDTDGNIFPYFRLDRELLKTKNGTLSAGLMYSYTATDLDTGIDYSSLDQAFEFRLQHHYLYDVNELEDRDARTDAATTIIFDAAALAADPFFAASPEAQAFYAGRTPQGGPATNTATPIYFDGEGLIGTPMLGADFVGIIAEKERLRLATFVGNSLDVSMHSLSAPVSWEWDLSDRSHLSLTAGVSLNVFNTELTSNIWTQDIEQLAAGRITYNNTDTLLVRTGASISGDFVEGSQGTPKTGGTSSGVAGTPGNPSSAGSIGSFPGGGTSAGAASIGIEPGAGSGSGNGNPAGGGKGGVALSPRLPGENVYAATRKDSSTDVQFGLFAQATFTYDLDQKDRWFLEAWGRYDWIQSFNVGNGVSNAEIDASSWAIGAGVGYRF